MDGSSQRHLGSQLCVTSIHGDCKGDAAHACALCDCGGYVCAEAAQPGGDPEDEAAHAKTHEDAADMLGDGGFMEGIDIIGEGDDEGPSAAAAKVDDRPAVLSISTAPDG